MNKSCLLYRDVRCYEDARPRKPRKIRLKAYKRSPTQTHFRYTNTLYKRATCTNIYNYRRLEFNYGVRVCLFVSI